MVSTLITSPEEFFEEQSDQIQISALAPRWVVFVVAVALALSPLAILQVVPQSSIISAAIWIAVLIQFAAAFVLWVLFAGGVFVVARVASGRVKSSPVFVAVGWGLLPLALGGVVRAGGYFLALRDYTFPDEAIRASELGPDTGLEMFAPGASYTQWSLYQETTRAATGDPLFLVAVIVFLGCIAWSAHLWRTALPHFADVEGRDATVSAAVPATVYALWFLSSVL